MKDNRIYMVRDKLMGGRGGAPPYALALAKGHIFAHFVPNVMHFFLCCLVGFNRKQGKHIVNS